MNPLLIVAVDVFVFLLGTVAFLMITDIVEEMTREEEESTIPRAEGPRHQAAQEATHPDHCSHPAGCCVYEAVGYDPQDQILDCERVCSCGTEARSSDVESGTLRPIEGLYSSHHALSLRLRYESDEDCRPEQSIWVGTDSGQVYWRDPVPLFRPRMRTLEGRPIDSTGVSSMTEYVSGLRGWEKILQDLSTLDRGGHRRALYTRKREYQMHQAIRWGGTHRNMAVVH